MVKLRKSRNPEWGIPERDLRKKTAEEEAYFRSILRHSDKGEDLVEEPDNEQELLENIFDRHAES